MSEEYVDVVNEKDEVIGRELKSLKPQKKFISRIVAVFIRNSKGQFIICKRGAHKKNDPNLYDLTALGNVFAGESYEDAALRELGEEVSISCELKRLDKFYQEIENNSNVLKIFCCVFLGISDSEPNLNHELSEYKLMSFEELKQELINNPQNYCKGLANDFNQVKDKLKQEI